MILPNIETFIGCESSFEEASIMVRRLILQQVFVRVPALVHQPCAMRVLAWRPTVRIRIRTLWTSVYLTVEIWSFVLAAVK